MTNKELFAQAIAEAKDIRKAAMENAKTALNETLGPKLDEIFNKAVNEADEIDENYGMNENSELDEILAELELEESNSTIEESTDLDENTDLDEAKDDDDKSDKKDDKKDDKPKAPKAPKSDSEPKSEEDSDDEPISKLSIEEFTNLIKGVIAQELAGGSAPESDLGGEDVSLDTPEIGDDLGGEAPDSLGTNMDDFGGEEEDDLAEIDLAEILAELDNLDEVDEQIEESTDKSKEELKEAIRTIKSLRKELNEVNVLNAKLMYSSKVISSFNNPSKSQIIKIYETFDRANTVKEAKLVFESLVSTAKTINTNKKSAIKESLGRASKPIGNAPNKSIVEVDETVSRWQFLAGINKK